MGRSNNNTTELVEAIRGIDPIILLAAIPVLIIALSNEAWWTLTGYNNSKLLSLKISPYYLSITATGFSGVPPTLVLLGSLGRILALSGFILLVLSALRPLAWWRNISYYGGLAATTSLYLIFLVMYHSAQIAFLTMYNIVLPYDGTTHLQANILGLDMKYYSTPLVSANFSLAFFAGFLTIAIALGSNIVRNFHYRYLARQDLIVSGIDDIHLSPPYQHVWLASNDTELNPLIKDPSTIPEDELLVSIGKMYNTIDPGGSLSIILPAWATTAEDRFQKLLPWAGFRIESSGVIYRTPGIPETELRFRKPIESSSESNEAKQEGVAEHRILLAQTELPTVQEEYPSSREIITTPDWQSTHMGRLDRIIVRSAVKIISQRQTPVPYRELLNQVYLDLVEKKLDFESSRQIETTLLNHTRKELELVEEADASGTKWVRKWWLGQKRVIESDDSGPNPITGFFQRVKHSIPTIRQKPIRSRKKSRYRPKQRKDED